MRNVLVLLALLFCLGCSDNNSSDNKYCKGKLDGAECDNSEGYCICFKGEAFQNIGRMCNELADCIDEECIGLHTGDSCGEGKVCSCGVGEVCTENRTAECLMLKSYD